MASTLPSLFEANEMNWSSLNSTTARPFLGGDSDLFQELQLSDFDLLIDYSDILSESPLDSLETIDSPPVNKSEQHAEFDESLLRLSLKQFRKAIANMSDEAQSQMKRARRSLQNKSASQTMRQRTKAQQAQLRDALTAQQTRQAAALATLSDCARKHFGDHPALAAFLEDAATAIYSSQNC